MAVLPILQGDPLEIIRLKRRTVLLGDSTVDGAALQWENIPDSTILLQMKTASLSVKEFDAHENKRMEMNAWWIAKDWLIV